MPFQVSLDPADEPAHWFLLDLAILRDHGRVLAGPPPRSWSARSPAAGCWRRCATRWPGTRPTSRSCSSGPQRQPGLALRLRGRLVLQARRRRLGPSRTGDPATVAAAGHPRTATRPAPRPGPRRAPSRPGPGRGRRGPGQLGQTGLRLRPWSRRMYGELAGWWPLLSAPAVVRRGGGDLPAAAGRGGRPAAGDRARAGLGRRQQRLHLKAHFRLTLVDLSPGMLEVSRKELTRSASTSRGTCGRSASAGLRRRVRPRRGHVHDPGGRTCGKVMETAFVHCRPGGVALFAPDHLRENFRTGTDWRRPRRRRAAPPASWSGPGTPTRSTPPTPSTTPTCCARPTARSGSSTTATSRGCSPGHLAAAAGGDRLRGPGGPGGALGAGAGQLRAVRRHQAARGRDTAGLGLLSARPSPRAAEPLALTSRTMSRSPGSLPPAKLSIFVRLRYAAYTVGPGAERRSCPSSGSAPLLQRPTIQIDT